MSKIKLSSNASGTGNVTVSSPATNTDRIITLPDGDGAMPLIKLETAKTATGTAVDFTSIPSWVKRITVMFAGVSTNGATSIQVQLGTGGTPTTSGYTSGATYVSTTNNLTRGTVSVTTGFRAYVADSASDLSTGSFVITNINSNTWVCNGALLVQGANTGGCNTFGSVALAGTLNLVRITSINGTDVFDAGTINIMYEG
jgi:hypothetical protein